MGFRLGKVKSEGDLWEEKEDGHVRWQWHNGLTEELAKLETGGSGAARGFEAAMTEAFGARLRQKLGLAAEFFEKIYRTRGINVGEAPNYSAREHEFAKYKSQIAKTRPLTEY